jgi:hypothetical protein
MPKSSLTMNGSVLILLLILGGGRRRAECLSEKGSLYASTLYQARLQSDKQTRFQTGRKQVVMRSMVATVIPHCSSTDSSRHSCTLPCGLLSVTSLSASDRMIQILLAHCVLEVTHQRNPVLLPTAPTL